MKVSNIIIIILIECIRIVLIPHYLSSISYYYEIGNLYLYNYRPKQLRSKLNPCSQGGNVIYMHITNYII